MPPSSAQDLALAPVWAAQLQTATKSLEANPLDYRRQRVAHVRRRLASLFGATALLTCLAPAFGESEWSGGVGVFVGLSLGEGSKVDWGLELFGVRLLEKPKYRTGNAVAGPVFRVSARGTQRPTLTLAAFAGAGSKPLMGTGAELGISAVLDGDATIWSLESGVLAELTVANVYLRRTWTVKETKVGGGLRLLPTFVHSFAINYD